MTETGWGEFDIQVKIIFVAESGEKPLTTYHRLKLHPWHPISMRAAEIETVAQEAAASTSLAENGDLGEQTADDDAPVPVEETIDVSMESDIKDESERPTLRADTDFQNQQIIEAKSNNSNINFPPVVHSWSYDEIVFPEPTEAFYEILIANPPTP